MRRLKCFRIPSFPLYVYQTMSAIACQISAVCLGTLTPISSRTVVKILCTFPLPARCKGEIVCGVIYPNTAFLAISGTTMPMKKISKNFRTHPSRPGSVFLKALVLLLPGFYIISAWPLLVTGSTSCPPSSVRLDLLFHRHLLAWDVARRPPPQQCPAWTPLPGDNRCLLTIQKRTREHHTS